MRFKEKRKAQKSNDSTVLVLPKRWVEASRIKDGDVLTCVYGEDETLVISKEKRS